MLHPVSPLSAVPPALPCSVGLRALGRLAAGDAAGDMLETPAEDSEPQRQHECGCAGSAGVLGATPFRQSPAHTLPGVPPSPSLFETVFPSPDQVARLPAVDGILEK